MPTVAIVLYCMEIDEYTTEDPSHSSLPKPKRMLQRHIQFPSQNLLALVFWESQRTETCRAPR